MATEPIPMITVRGSHYEVGRQIGEELRPTMQRMLSTLGTGLPAGVALEDLRQQGRIYLAHSRAVYPQYVRELEGIAAGANLPFHDLFLELCEELWEEAAWRNLGPGWRGTPDGHHAASAGPGRVKGCSDMVARGRATVDGSTLVAHTNDLGPEVEESLVLLKVQAGDEPEFLACSVGGLGYSAGFNAAGIVMSGNQLSNSDIRPGVPRLLAVRAILAARRLEEAMAACLLPRRASNYNNVIADANGEVYSMEGSATDCEPIYIEGDILAHANHYASSTMRHFEADRNDIAGSVIRHNRAMRLLRENYGRLSPELFRTLLADHANFPGSLCKHGLDSVTVFSMIVNPEERRAWFGRGRPCQATYHEHALEPWNWDRA
jgi:isopenicillin-N N-acyltransferase like protein